MKKKIFTLFFAICLIVPAMFMFLACSKNDTDNIQVRVGEEYIEWSNNGTVWNNIISIDDIKDMLKNDENFKGDAGSVVTIGEDGYWYIDGVNTGVQAAHKDPTYTVTYDDTYAICFDDVSMDVVTKGDWLVDLPIVKDEFADKFLGWFIKNSEVEIKNGDEIKANVILEARFTEKPYDAEIYAIYELALGNGYTGTYEEWLASIKGEKGDTGATGPQGPKGDAGSVVTIGEDGYWYIDGVNTGVTGP